jgi:catechol 2,3-dioxygenase-like lactoylglutathione lyase family enzyme
MDFKLEVVTIPVADVDRAKAFYEQIGFKVDVDQSPTEGLRFVQVTPPGSACSIAFGTGLGLDPEHELGRAQLQVVVGDVHAARAELAEHGVDAGEVQVFPWGSFVSFSDPDGNNWAVQQLPPR